MTFDPDPGDHWLLKKHLGGAWHAGRPAGCHGSVLLWCLAAGSEGVTLPLKIGGGCFPPFCDEAKSCGLSILFIDTPVS